MHENNERWEDIQSWTVSGDWHNDKWYKKESKETLRVTQNVDEEHPPSIHFTQKKRLLTKFMVLEIIPVFSHW